ncbi:MAG: acyl-CoA dehydrogenase family protein [Hydrotalea sp.]|nr:acyl-CoA dehydrogenase family protein [Hydrotalea sp.]
MDFTLSQEQEMIVNTVRTFVEKEFYPLEDEVERTDRVPAELGKAIQKKVKDLGFYAANIPTEFGGGGLNHLEFTLLERELGRANYGLATYFGRPSAILCAGTPDQQKDYLAPCVAGEKMDCLAMTEPDAGSDVRGMKTFAKRDGDDFVISGTKHFISHADIADFVILFAATGEEQTKKGTKKIITCFLVDKGTKGFECLPGYKSVSHRGYHNSILKFDNCRINQRQILGGVEREGMGFDTMNKWLYATRLTVATMAVGRARRAFDLALNWAATRKQFGQEIGKFQGVSFKLAEMITEIDCADWLTLSAADRLDKGMDANREVASAKYYATEMLTRVADQAIQIYGGMGLMNEIPLERIWRDSRVERIWDGTTEIQKHIISRELLRPLGA